MEVPDCGGIQEIIVWIKILVSECEYMYRFNYFSHLHLNTFVMKKDHFCSFPMYAAFCRTGIAGTKSFSYIMISDVPCMIKT